MKSESEGCAYCGGYCWDDDSQIIMTGADKQWIHNSCKIEWENYQLMEQHDKDKIIG